MNEKVVLIIMDGWGITQDSAISAIAKGKTPFVDSLYTQYPNAQLSASGLDVGLPEGQMGNSEVGHMNLGAGRIVYQDLVKINKAIADRSIAENKVFTDTVEYAKRNNKKLHFIGLLSDGGVHAHIDHVLGMSKIAKDMGLDDINLHAFTDGRDCDPESGKGFVQKTVDFFDQNQCGKLASITGRYYAMDRDNRWERVALAYQAMVNAEGTKATNAADAIQASYDEGVTDEFIKPIIMTTEDGTPVAKIEEGDAVICFNFRTDRGREITKALTQEDFPEFGMHKLDLYYTTLTRYDVSFKGVNVVFEKDNLNNTIGEVLESAGKRQIRIAETEKYPHVTFFFSGGREQEFKGEKRLLVPSPKVATYDLKPEMSAEEVKQLIVAELENEWPDFVCLNFANPDMVGHTGDMNAAIKACETVDNMVNQVVKAGLAHNYSFIILADHGNSEQMKNPDGSAHTAHTTNPVPYFYVSNHKQGKLENGKLGDVAPTILHLMGVGIPKDMTGNNLIEK